MGHADFFGYESDDADCRAFASQDLSGASHAPDPAVAAGALRRALSSAPRPCSKGSPEAPGRSARRSPMTQPLSPRHFTLEAGGSWPADDAPPVMRPMSAPRRLPSESIARRFPQQRPCRPPEQTPERPHDPRREIRPRPRRSPGAIQASTGNRFADSCPSAGRTRLEAAMSSSSRSLGDPGDTGCHATSKASGCPTCAICLEALLDAAVDPCRAALGLACGHAFHGACIQRWLSTARRRTCPLCNTKVEIGES